MILGSPQYIDKSDQFFKSPTYADLSMDYSKLFNEGALQGLGIQTPNLSDEDKIALEKQRLKNLVLEEFKSNLSKSTLPIAGYTTKELQDRYGSKGISAFTYDNIGELENTAFELQSKGEYFKNMAAQFGAITWSQFKNGLMKS